MFVNLSLRPLLPPDPFRHLQVFFPPSAEGVTWQERQKMTLEAPWLAPSSAPPSAPRCTPSTPPLPQHSSASVSLHRRGDLFRGGVGLEVGAWGPVLKLHGLSRHGLNLDSGGSDGSGGCPAVPGQPWRRQRLSPIPHSQVWVRRGGKSFPTWEEHWECPPGTKEGLCARTPESSLSTGQELLGRGAQHTAALLHPSPLSGC